MRLRFQLSRISVLLVAGLGSGWASGADIVVGQIAPLTGNVAEQGRVAADSMKACIDSINAKGGISGRKIKYFLKDDGYDAQRYADAAKELVETNKAVVILSSAGTSGPYQLLKSGFFDQYKIPLIAPVSGALQLRYPFNPYIFHIRASYPDEIAKLVDQLKVNGRQRIAILYQDDPDGKAAYGIARLSLKKQGMELVAAAPYNKDTNDVDAAARTIVAAAPDTVLHFGLEAPVASFLQKSRAAGLNAQVFGLSVLDVKTLAKAAGPDLIRGMGITQVMPYPFSGTSPVVKDYRAVMKKFAPKTDISYIGMEMYVGCKLMEAGLRKTTGNPSSLDVLNGLGKIDKLELGGFTLNYAPDSRIGSKFVDVTVVGPDAILMR